MSMYFLDEQSWAKFQELARWFDANVGGTTGSGTSDPLANNLVPFELSAGPTQNDDGAWVAQGKPLYFNGENCYDLNADVNDYAADVFFPLSKDAPSYKQGDRLFCIHRGRWEAFEGSTTPGELSGVVMEAIKRTPDPTSDPAEYTFGKVRVTLSVFGQRRFQ